MLTLSYHDLADLADLAFLGLPKLWGRSTGLGLFRSTALTAESPLPNFFLIVAFKGGGTFDSRDLKHRVEGALMSLDFEGNLIETLVLGLVLLMVVGVCARIFSELLIVLFKISCSAVSGLHSPTCR